MSIFKNIFSRVLKEEIINLTEYSTWNTGIMTNTIGPNFKLDKPTQRHRKIIKDPGFRKYAQTVPDMHKVNPNAIQPLEDLKKSTNGKRILSQDEIEKIAKQFGVSRLSSMAPKKLGNTGIVMRYDPDARGYVIEK